MSIVGVIDKVRPTEIYNLAAQSHVQVSFDSPEFTADVDAVGVLRILEAVRVCGLTDSCRIYQASTSELYGKVEEVPQNENTPFHPYSPYAVAKQYGFWIVKEYRDAYNMFACNGILFNHESERRGETFVTRKITLAAARIKQGKQDKLFLGNLSSRRDGFVMGEGAGCIVLEELEHAKARGAKIYAEMVGEGESADAHHITAPHPEGLGAKLVMEAALSDANLKPEDIDYINVHGTSTHLGDLSESMAIKQVFGEAAYKLNISSTKSMTGHMLGAAGAVEAMASILAVKNDIVPPTINHEEGDDDPDIDYKLNFTFNKAQKRTVRAALSNTFGFGGHNACVLFKKYAE